MIVGDLQILVLAEADANLSGDNRLGVELPKNGRFRLELNEEGSDISPRDVDLSLTHSKFVKSLGTGTNGYPMGHKQPDCGSATYSTCDFGSVNRGLELELGPGHSLEDLDGEYKPRYALSPTDSADKKRKGVSTLREEKDDEMDSTASMFSSQPGREVDALPGTIHSERRGAGDAVAE